MFNHQRSRRSSNTAWIQYRQPRPRARLRLFCFPYAGGGASLYRAFGQQLPEEVEVWPVQLPGRERRLQEPAYARMEPLIDALLEALDPYLNFPYAIFGHSMGALIGFELVRALRQRKCQKPVHLFVSAHRAPHLPALGTPTYHLSEEQFVARLQSLNGTPEEVIAHPELMQVLLPLLRADFELCETYQWRQDAPLTCALSAYGGLSDAETPRESILAWREHTSARFKARFFPGEHFYFHHAQQALLFALAQELAREVQALS